MNKFSEYVYGALFGLFVSILHRDQLISDTLTYWLVALGALFILSKHLIEFWLHSTKIETVSAFFVKGGLSRVYTDLLLKVLDWLDTKLCPPEMLDMTDPRFAHPPRWQRAWNWLSYDRALFVAMIYPIGMPMVLWLLSGEALSMGKMRVLLETEDGWQYVFAWAAVFIILVSKRIATVTTRHVFHPMLAALARTGTDEEMESELRIVVQFALVLVAAALFLQLDSTFGAIPAMVALSLTAGVSFGSCIGAISFAGAISLAITSVLLLHFGSEAGFLYILVFAGSVAVTADVFRNPENRELRLLVFLILMLLAIFLTVKYSSGKLADLSYILFLGFFPFVNAFWDFVSIGLTRWSLRNALAGRRLFKGVFVKTNGLPQEFTAVIYWVIDVIGALFTMTGLILSLFVGLHWLNQMTGQPILPLTRVIADLRPGEFGPDMTWFYVMIFSTWLPTLVHFAILMFSLFIRFPGKRFLRQMSGMAKENHQAYAIRISQIIALQITTTVAVLALAVYYLLPGIGENIVANMSWVVSKVAWLVAILQLR